MKKLNIYTKKLQSGMVIHKPVVPLSITKGWLFSPDEDENETTILLFFELNENKYLTKEWVYTHKNGAVSSFSQTWPEGPPQPESKKAYDYYLLDNDEELTLIKIKYGFTG